MDIGRDGGDFPPIFKKASFGRKIQSTREGRVTYALQLERIKNDFERAKKKSEKPFGLNSFTAYCKSERARFDRRQCQRLVNCLPNDRLAKSGPTGPEVNWTEGALREVGKLKTNVARKSALKAAAEDHVENATPLTTAVRNAVAEKKTFASEIKAAKIFLNNVFLQL